MSASHSLAVRAARERISNDGEIKAHTGQMSEILPSRSGGGRHTLTGCVPRRTRAMLPSRAALVAAAVLLLLVATPQAVTQMTVVDPDSWAAAADYGAACTGTVEECVAAASARRELAGKSYISYDAMSRGRVPCSIRGASYYNCRPGAPANSYSRGCSAITRCRG